MSKITVTIQRSNIYHIAEGISVSISQHNGGTPSYEQLWASPDESQKLDIYYREAISDLERQLTLWVEETSAQFNLKQDGEDYVLVLDMNRYWPTRLLGLLTNKIQDYLVHAVTAGWLNDFAGLEVKQDYQAMASQDLSDIRAVIYKREYGFNGAERTDDSDKDPALFRPEAGLRRADNINKHSNDDTPPYCRPKNLRHRDNDIVDTRGEYTDWSGTGMAYAATPMSCPVCPPPVVGNLDPRGVSIHHHPGRPMPHHCCPPVPVKDPRIPDNPTHPNYPPIHVDGIGWSDKALYDYEGSEHYINN